MTSLIRNFAGMFSRRSFNLGVGNWDRLLDVVASGGQAAVGLGVTKASALQVPAAWASVDLISKAGAIMPGHVYRRLSGEGPKKRERADRHYLYTLVHDKANPDLLASLWRRLALVHLNTWGNHYSWIEWTVANRAKAIWPLPPSRVRAERESSTSPIRYFVQDKAGKWNEFPSADILHIRGLGDETVGYSPVEMHRKAFGLAEANQNSAAMLHQSGMTSRLVIKLPGGATEEQQKEARESFEALYANQNKFKAIVLQNGMEAMPISIKPSDAQFLEQGKYSDAKIYQIYGVPPHMIGDTEKSTSWGTGIEQQTIGFVTFTMLPWMDLIEESLAAKLLPDDRSHFIEYDFKVLMRGDSAARSKWYRDRIEEGSYCPNDVLTHENEDPYPGGEVFRRPINTAFVDRDGKPVMLALPPAQNAKETPNEEIAAI